METIKKQRINKHIKDEVDHQPTEYDGYEISINGDLWSVPRIDNRGRNVVGGYVTAKNNRGGYLYYQIRLNGKIKCLYSHRLVALAFISGRSTERNTVDHIDRNTHNNHLSNLRWVTNRFNTSCHKKDCGISWVTAQQKWRVDIRLTNDRKQIYLGVYNCKETALTKYQKALFIIEAKYSTIKTMELLQSLKD